MTQIGMSQRMLICMRTTLNLSDGLMEAAKRCAKAERRTLTSFIEDAVRQTPGRNSPAARR